MKKTLFFLLLGVLCSSCQDEQLPEMSQPVVMTRSAMASTGDAFYYFKGEKYALEKSPDETFIVFKEKDKEELLSKFQKDGIEFNENTIQPIEHPGITALDGKPVSGDLVWAKILMNEEQASEYPEIEYFSPYFKKGDRTFPLTNLLYVSLRNAGDLDMLKEAAAAAGVKVSGSADGIPNLYVLSCTKSSTGNALEIANRMEESGMFEYVQASFIDVYPCTNDTYYAQQWNLHNTGQNGGLSGIDIRYAQAYSMIPSSSSITVGVIDSGIDLTHNDLNLSTTSWDAVANQSPSMNYDEDERNHGTNVAGIICAKKNNSRGIAGVSSPTKVVPISIKYSDEHSDVFVARGIRKAADLGVSVINLSLTTGLHNAIIDSAIQYAVEFGRDGKGCVIVCSTGNDNHEYISYPASTTPQNYVIAVGAINRAGGRSSISSPFIGSFGSNYGSGLDLVAPGEGIPTTKRGGNYELDFSGTSAAAPHVSAVAALILSKNPDLRYNEVEYILCRTANKSLPGYTYGNGGFKGTWNMEVGHGLLNMQSALTMAQSTTGNGNMSISGGGSANMEGTGYAWSHLTASPDNLNYTYFWSGEFLGQCDRWYIWPTNEYGSSADVSVYLNPGQTGGTLVVTCKAFSGNTYVGKATTYVYVTPNSNEY